LLKIKKIKKGDEQKKVTFKSRIWR